MKYEGIVEIRALRGPCQEVVNELLAARWVLLDFTFVDHTRSDGTLYFDVAYILGRKEREDE